MHRAAKLGALLLVFLMAGAPVVACMLPASSMSDDEQQCCREMAGQCGQPDMPSSHSCCKTLAGPVQLTVAKAPFDLQGQCIMYDLPLATHDLQAVTRISIAPVHGANHSPPTAPPLSPDILRI
jgi:hypothetical protein